MYSAASNLNISLKFLKCDSLLGTMKLKIAYLHIAETYTCEVEMSIQHIEETKFQKQNKIK